MSDSIFTQIINGQIPCHKVYEDDKTFAFMDIHPIQPGHVLVVTKSPAETFLDLDEVDAVAFWNTIRKVGDKLKEVYPEKRRIGLIIEGLDVAHAHAKVFPIDTSAQLRTIPDLEAEPDHTTLAAQADKIRIN